MYAQTTVDSLEDLMPFLDDDHVNVQLSPGIYTITSDNASKYGRHETIETQTIYTLFPFSGSHSTYDFTGVTINVETPVFRAFGNIDVYKIRISGNNNILQNLNLVDLGSVHDNPRRGALSLTMDGKENLVDGFYIASKGSKPYGYGDIFGKGSGSLVALDKHSGVLIRGDYNVLRNTTVIHRAFGHCVMMQAANHPTIEGCYIEGEMRTTDDILNEEGSGSIADQQDFMTTWGYKLPAGFMIALCEEGIRSYNRGVTTINGVAYSRGSNDITIKNTTVKNTRTGCAIAQSSGKNFVENVSLIGNEAGFSIGSGVILDSYADAAYGPAYDNGKNVAGNITIIAPIDGYYNGSKCIASITGGTHTLNYTTSDIPSNMSIQVGTYLSFRHQEGTNLLYQLTTKVSNTNLFNHNDSPIELGEETSANEIYTCGEVIDHGTNNTISVASTCIQTPDCDVLSAFSRIQAEDYCSQSGVRNLDTKIGYINDGDWIAFDAIDFGDGADHIHARAASNSSGGTIEIRLGSVSGTLLGSLEVSHTGGWDVWETITGPISPIREHQKVYFVFKGHANGLFDIDWIRFTENNTLRQPNLEAKSPEIRCFPNPVADQLFLQKGKTSTSTTFQAELLDISGKVLDQKSFNASNQTFDMHVLPSGVYLMRITGANRAKIFKVIKI